MSDDVAHLLASIELSEYAPAFAASQWARVSALQVSF